MQATAIVAGDNYGQGSSREHAAVASRYLGVRVVLARSFSRIHYSNLLQFGILALNLESDNKDIQIDDELELTHLHQWLDRIIEDTMAIERMNIVYTQSRIKHRIRISKSGIIIHHD